MSILLNYKLATVCVEYLVCLLSPYKNTNSDLLFGIVWYLGTQTSCYNGRSELYWGGELVDRPSLSKCECVIVFLSGKCPSETLSIKSLQLKASVKFIIWSRTSMAEKV